MNKKTEANNPTLAFVWPTEAARNVVFQVPKSWTGCSDGSKLCRLEFDETERFIRIVDATNPAITLDVIDVDDMIGAGIEIKLRTTDSTMDKNNDLHVSDTTGLLKNDLDSNLGERRDLNEPKYDLLSDKQGCAVLSIYVYPREDYSKYYSLSALVSTLWSIIACILCYTFHETTPRQQPQPNYKRPMPTTALGPLPNCGHRFPSHRLLTLEPIEDFHHVQSLVAALRQLATESSLPLSNGNLSVSAPSNTSATNKCLIIVNPCSGPKRNGKAVCSELVKPMLEEAGFDIKVVVTTHANHAKELVSGVQTDDADGAIDLLHYNSLVLLGGDGIVHEVLNGISNRPDSETIFNAITIGIVGCGTANGMASSLAFASQEKWGAINETFLIAKKQTSQIDLSHYEIWTNHRTLCNSTNDNKTNDKYTLLSSTSAGSSSENQNNNNDATAKGTDAKISKYTGCLTFSWAIISDIDLESECIQWFGPRRFDVFGAIRLLFLRKYKAKFSYRPTTAGMVDTGATTTCSTTNSSSNNKNKNTNNTMLVAITEPVPDDWKVIEDDFILFYPSHVTHAGMNVYNSPPSKLQDGIFQVMIIRGNTSLLRLIPIFLGLETGTHVGQPGCEFVECSAFRLEPDPSNKRISKNNIDGEAVDDGPIQGCVQPGAVRVYCNPKDKKPLK